MTEPTKNKGGRPRNAARDKFETDLGVSARRIQQLMQEMSLDQINDMGELKLIEKRIVIALRSLQARREEHELSIAQRKLISIEEAQRAGMEIGMAVSTGLHNLMSNLPTMLAGRDEMGVYNILRQEFGTLIESIREEAAKIK